MSEPNIFPAIKPVGINGMLVQFSDKLQEPSNRAALSFCASIRQKNWPCVEEISATLASAYLRFDIQKASHEELIQDLQALLNTQNWYEAPLPQGRRHLEIPCVFGGEHGPQLEEAATVAKLSTQDAIKELTTVRTRVLAVGFAPGQPYLGELDEHWNIPRLTALTRQVPKGALIVAIKQLIIFTAPSPTGWRHIGQCAFDCFRPDQENPFAFRPGDEVSLRDISSKDLSCIKATDRTGNGGAVISPIL
ncbi:MAG: allophanate hydrolase subunit 1 [Paracoccaceae bacterium]|nr:allophanate hydrolase subunit 1 [Paracoccaceae bacterium]